MRQNKKKGRLDSEVDKLCSIREAISAVQDGAMVEEGIPEEAEWPEEDVVVVEEDKGAVG